MSKFREFSKKYSNEGLIATLFIFVVICQLLLFSLSLQKISFLGFMLDISFYAILFGLISLIKNVPTRKVFLIILFSLLCVIFIADGIYVGYYHNYASVKVVSELKNVGVGEKTDMGLRLISTSLIQSALLAFGIALTIMSSLERKAKPAKLKLRAFCLATLIASFSLFNGSMFYQIKTKAFASMEEYYLSDTFLYDSLYSTNNYVEKYGYVNFRIKDITFTPKNEIDVYGIEKYINNRSQKSINSQTGAFQDYNIINILSETFDTKLITYIDTQLKTDSNPTNDDLFEKLMPTFYAIYNGTAGDAYAWDSGSLVFENYYSPRFSTGSTINSEFMSLTSLYPYYNTYWSNNMGNHRSDRYFGTYSLPAQLSERYDTYYFHGNGSYFYNRTSLIPNMGFEKYCFSSDSKYKDYFSKAETSWKYDENLIYFFEQEIDTTKPFYANVLTYSMHFGSDELYRDTDNRAANLYNALVNSYDEKIVSDQTNTYLKNYFEKAIYFDNFLKELLNWIDVNNVPKTIINIYPDHYNYAIATTDRTGELYEEYFGTSNLDNEVHKMALTTFITDGFTEYKTAYATEDNLKTSCNMVYEGYISTVDLVPTFLNWLQKTPNEFDYRYFFGNDYFDVPEDNYVFFSDLSLATTGLMYNVSGEVSKLEGCYVGEKIPNDMIDAAQHKLASVIEQLEVNKAIINLDFFKWLKIKE